jgi:hypothetical protein
MSAKRASVVALFAFLAGTFVICSAIGCASKNRSAPAAKPYGVTIAPSREASAKPAPGAEDEPGLLPRAFAFEMAGFSAPVHGATQEQRTAAAQAAIIDAFCRALIEARRARGQSGVDFTTAIGSRLTVRHCKTDDGYQVEIGVISRGVETSFVVRNGRLQHPPHDVKLLQRIFDETNGEFSLLGTEWQPGAGICVAKVGCYIPAGSSTGMESTMAGEVKNDPADAPSTP